MLGAPGRRAPSPGEAPDPVLPDSRESEEWFQTLDPYAQDVVREKWLARDLDWERVTRCARSDLGGAFTQGIVLLGGLQLLLVVTLGMVLKSFAGGITVGSMIAQLGLACAAGAALGGLWSALRAGVLICIFTAMAASALVQWIACASGWIPLAALFCGPALAGFSAGYLGTRREELPGS